MPADHSDGATTRLEASPPPCVDAPQTLLRTAGFPLASEWSSNRRIGALRHTPQRTPLANAPTRANTPPPANPRKAESDWRRGRRRRLNASQIRWLYPLPPHRFHVLFNSLFKVLCNFPSRYLFAIGFVVVFSLRWSLPPSLGCVPKQPDSESTPGGRRQPRSYRPSTFSGAPVKGDLERRRRRR